MVEKNKIVIRRWFTPKQACKYLSDELNFKVKENDLKSYIMDNELVLSFEILDGNIEIVEVDDFVNIGLTYLNNIEIVDDFHDDFQYCSDTVTNEYCNYHGILTFKNNTITPTYFDFTNELNSNLTELLLGITDENDVIKIFYSDTILCTFYRNPMFATSIYEFDPPNLDFVNRVKKELLNKYPPEANGEAGFKPYIYFPIKKGKVGFEKKHLDFFIESQKAQTEPTPETREPKELNTNERNSLHALIYALTLKDVEADLQSAVPHDTGASKTDTASKIKARLDKQGINLTAKTIREHIKNAHETAQELKK